MRQLANNLAGWMHLTLNNVAQAKVYCVLRVMNYLVNLSISLISTAHPDTRQVFHFHRINSAYFLSWIEKVLNFEHLQKGMIDFFFLKKKKNSQQTHYIYIYCKREFSQITMQEHPCSRVFQTQKRNKS